METHAHARHARNDKAHDIISELNYIPAYNLGSRISLEYPPTCKLHCWVTERDFLTRCRSCLPIGLIHGILGTYRAPLIVF